MGRSLRIGDLVEVEWFDAWADHDTTTRSQWRDTARAITRGELVRLTDTVVSIAMETFPDSNEYRCVTHIPRPIVKHMRRLEHAGP